MWVAGREENLGTTGNNKPQTPPKTVPRDIGKSSAQQSAKHERCIRSDTTLIREAENSHTAFELDQSTNAAHNLKNRDGNDRGC
jgi:hypothetical protein